MLSQTALRDSSVSTPLGDAFRLHMQQYRSDPDYALPHIEQVWLDLIHDRAARTAERSLAALVQEMSDMLAAPSDYPAAYKNEFQARYDQACAMVYPLTRALIKAQQEIAGITRDYTLSCLDLGLVRAFEGEALADPSMRDFVASMRKKLNSATQAPSHEVYREVFEIYSEAAVCYLLRRRASGRLTIEKFAETSTPGPDFVCRLAVDRNGTPAELIFYIEVKAFDIVDPKRRLPEMIDDGMDAQIALEEQLAQGSTFATAEAEIAPLKPSGPAPDYDPRSVRLAIEKIAEKAANNFGSAQFKQGPTFALVNLLRLPLPGQGASTLAPSFYDDVNGGACVSGVLWHVAFGKLGWPIYRYPEFEGDGTADGTLTREGILADPALALPAAGLIVLHYDQGAYRFDGLYDARWENALGTWTNLETEEVLHALCDAFNDSDNSKAHLYARYRNR